MDGFGIHEPQRRPCRRPRRQRFVPGRFGIITSRDKWVKAQRCPLITLEEWSRHRWLQFHRLARWRYRRHEPMLLSVTERTRGIGGAKSRVIVWQFLFEAMTLIGTGRIIALILVNPLVLISSG